MPPQRGRRVIAARDICKGEVIILTIVVVIRILFLIMKSQVVMIDFPSAVAPLHSSLPMCLE